MMERTQSHLPKAGDPLPQVLLGILWGSFSCAVMLELCSALRCQFIHLGRSHFSPPCWVSDKLPPLLALSHTRVGRVLYKFWKFVIPYWGVQPQAKILCVIFQTRPWEITRCCLAGLMRRSCLSHARLWCTTNTLQFPGGRCSQGLGSPSPHPNQPCSHTCPHS